MGETAATKLLVPMIMMLAVVMAIIMIPAFLRSMDDCIKNEEVKQCGIICKQQKNLYTKKMQ